MVGGELNERARYDALQVEESTPRWPSALRHVNLPEGLRSTGIDNFCRLLVTQQSPTVCVLVYELCTDVPRGTTMRLVLDGNHRLAAARRLWLGDSSCSVEWPNPRRFRVLTFLIRERQAVDVPTHTDTQAESSYGWRGFTPDIGLIRGTWRPDHPLA